MIHSLLTSSGYDILKYTINNILTEESNETSKLVLECIDRAINQFLTKYGYKYGKYEESFLARESNISLILRSTFLSESIDLFNKIDRNGYDNAPLVDDEGLKYFIDLLIGEFKRERELDNIISIKKHHRTTLDQHQEIIDVLSQLINQLTPKKEIINDIEKWYITGADGTKKEYKPGDKIRTKFGKSGYCEYRIINNIHYIEVLDDNGDLSYYEVDIDGNVKDCKFPYPLEEYNIIFNESDILKKDVQYLNNGFRKETIKFKWNKNAEIIYNLQNKLAHIRLSGGWEVSHKNKLIEMLK